MTAAVTPLGYALLGLIRTEPRSGYALRKVFETTPMGNYSSSPGSIYPALKALQKGALIEGRAAGRGSVFHLTASGETAFDAWLRTPIDVDAVAQHMSVVMLRFAFLTGHPDRQLTYDLLSSLDTAARQHAAGLQAWLATEDGQAMPLQAQLAVEQGRRSVIAVADWAADAHQQLQTAVEANP